MTTQQDPGPELMTCWTVQPVDPEDMGREGRLRQRLLELIRLGYQRILLDLSACAVVPIGKLHVLRELVTWFDGAPVDIRALAPGDDLRRLLHDAGVAPPVPVVARLADALEEADGEQGVFLTYALTWPHGTAAERAMLDDLAERLGRAVAPSGGEIDGYDVVDEQGVFYLYGPDCIGLWECLRPDAVRDQPPLVGIELRFGGLCAPHVHLGRGLRVARACV